MKLNLVVAFAHIVTVTGTNMMSCVNDPGPTSGA
jgi:hypothetical protein